MDEDDYENDPWENNNDDFKRASNSNGKNKKANPFTDNKVKSAFEDLNDDKPQIPITKPNLPDIATHKKNEEDNGLIVDNDFGDDYEEEEEDEEDDGEDHA